MKSIPALWFVIHVTCVVCGAEAAHLEFVPPRCWPVRWRFWSTELKKDYGERRDPLLWWLIVESRLHTNGAGENATAEAAQRFKNAFAYPRTYARVRSAALTGDAGFCPGCDVPYCARHWKPGQHGRTYCPLGHSL